MRLRALEPEDLQLLYDAENRMEDWNASGATVPCSRRVLEKYIFTQTLDIHADKQVRMVAEEDGVAVALVDLQNYEPLYNRAELGIMVMPEFRGRGLSSKAVTLMEQYARERVHIHQLYAIVAEDNEASRRMLLNCGFAVTAELRDWLYDGKTYIPAVLMTKLL